MRSLTHSALARCAAALCGLLTLGSIAAAQEDRFVAIKAKTIITGTGQEFSPGILVIRNGKVEAVGKKIALPPKAIVIDASDQVLMPGFVLARSRHSLKPFRRSGNHSHLSVEKELFPRKGDMEALLKRGYVAVALIPDGNGVPGQAMVVRPTDDPLAERTLHGAGYLRVTFQNMPSDKVLLRSAFKEAETWIERIEKARKAWEAAKKVADAKAKAAAAAIKNAGKKGPVKPSPRRTPVPAPRPAPRPVPRRMPLEDLSEDPALGPDEYEDEESLSRQAWGVEGEPFDGISFDRLHLGMWRILPRALDGGHDKDPHEGHLPDPVGVDPEALDLAPTPPRRPAPRGRSATPSKTFKAPTVPDRAKVFMDYVQKPGQGARLVLELGRASDYLHFVDGFEERKLGPAFFLSSGSDFHHLIDRLGKASARVLIRPQVTYEPSTRTRRNLPRELSKAGCTIAFQPTRAETFRQEVAILVREGFDRNEAIRAMTQGPAALLGLGAELGTLEKGRMADVILLDADPFTPGSKVKRVLIGGEPVWPREEESK